MDKIFLLHIAYRKSKLASARPRAGLLTMKIDIKNIKIFYKSRAISQIVNFRVRELEYELTIINNKITSQRKEISTRMPGWALFKKNILSFRKNFLQT